MSTKETLDKEATLRTLDNLKVTETLGAVKKTDFTEAVRSQDLETLTKLHERVIQRKDALLTAAEQVLASPQEVLYQRSSNPVDVNGIVFVREIDGARFEVAPARDIIPQSITKLATGMPVEFGVVKLPLDTSHFQELYESLEPQAWSEHPDISVAVLWDPMHKEKVTVSSYQSEQEGSFIQTSWTTERRNSINGEPQKELVTITTQADKTPRFSLHRITGEKTERAATNAGEYITESVSFPTPDNSLVHEKEVNRALPGGEWVTEASFQAECLPNERGWKIRWATQYDHAGGRLNFYYDSPSQGRPPVDANFVSNHQLLQEAGITLGGNMAPDIDQLQKMVLSAIPQ